MLCNGTKVVLAPLHRPRIRGPPRLTHTLSKARTTRTKNWPVGLQGLQTQNRWVAKCQQIPDKIQMHPGAFRSSWRGLWLRGGTSRPMNRRSHAHTYLLFLPRAPVAADSVTLVLRSNVVPFGPCNSGLRLCAVM